MSDLNIKAENGWCEAEPSLDAPQLLSEESGRLRLLNGDLSMDHDFGAVGPVDCPIAYDAARRLAFRYVCKAGYQGGDFSQLRAFSVTHKESTLLKELLPNQWVLWFLEWISGGGDVPGQLFGLMARDRPEESQIVIEHRLFTAGGGDDLLRFRPLCRDAYKPLAISRKRRELVFVGADGIYLLSFRGERKLSMADAASVSGHGADFSPDGRAKLVVGGDGLHLWDLERNTHVRLTRNGRYPVWSPDGVGIWYRESSGGLLYYDLVSEEVREILCLADLKYPDFWHARPVSISGDGRFLATCLTRKMLRGVSQKGSATGQRERVYVHQHAICVLDTEARTYWTREGFSNHLRWAE